MVLSWGFSMSWWGAAAEGEELLQPGLGSSQRGKTWPKYVCRLASLSTASNWARTAALLCSGCIVIPDRLHSKRGGSGLWGLGLLMHCTKHLRGLQLITAVTEGGDGGWEQGVLSRADVEGVCLCISNQHGCVCVQAWTPWAAGQGSGSGCGISRTWESGLNSRHSLASEATAVSGCLLRNLSYILWVFVRVLCQAHWLWKNNLTGFNLLPPPPSSSLLPLAFFFFL